MRIIGPFWREKPTAVTMHATWAWCYLYLDEQGRTAAIEWLT